MNVSIDSFVPAGSSLGTCTSMSMSARSLACDQFSWLIIVRLPAVMFVQLVCDPVQLKLPVSVLLSALHWK